MSSVSLRPLAGPEELEACVELQGAVWGEGFTDRVPAAILQVTQKIGGFLGGAFDGERLVGFVYSLLGSQEGQVIHWSHMLGVHPDARGEGLGRRLKLFQREELLERGVRRVLWTFDPMSSRNAHLNINRLGAHVVEYVPNMYGAATGSPLHTGETDRFVVRWDLDSARVKWAVESDLPREPPRAAFEAPIVAPASLAGGAEELEALEDPVRIAVPPDLRALGPRDLQIWRESIRRAFLAYLRRGYAVQSFHREPASRRCTYVLGRP